MSKIKALNARRQRRQNRVRNQLRGTPDRPRVSVFRSNRHMSVQIIDDMSGRTLASASTLDKGLRGEITKKGTKEAAAIIGKTLAERALAAGVKSVKFDRGHYKYHGRVAALADAAREGGLSF